MRNPLPTDVQALLLSGRVIEAIRRLRELTGMGLKEAKDAIDAGGWDGAQAPFAGQPGPAVQQALHAGQYIDALRLLRDEQPGLGLKEAKQALDDYLVSHPALQQQVQASQAEQHKAWRKLGFLALTVLISWAVMQFAS
ncbi:ribosomal protein L7/L12 [Inhella inkyongensis]|uniref:Ribosomal protein L7/L12 n=1 Tax=Inhella inkyongensis TaxID=392593 RepID=A0A840S4A9_9BURK|nr:hypothetical protein [Inhella inkyongensis]MBB5203349.1 ribosomal protein L7/L12 [Inhella inkyongensis]